MSPRTRRAKSTDGNQPQIILPEPPLPLAGKLSNAASPIEITWAEEHLRPNAVVQVTVGPHRGLLAIIGEVNGSSLKLYYVQSNGIGNAEIQSSECVVIGSARVAARNPFGESSPDIKSDPLSSFEE